MKVNIALSKFGVTMINPSMDNIVLHQCMDRDSHARYSKQYLFGVRYAVYREL